MNPIHALAIVAMLTLFVMGIYKAMQPDNILSFVPVIAKWMHKGKYFNKALHGCPVCMSTIYGGTGYVLLVRLFYDVWLFLPEGFAYLYALPVFTLSTSGSIALFVNLINKASALLQAYANPMRVARARTKRTADHVVTFPPTTIGG